MKTVGEEIKQSQFIDARHECMVNILYTASCLNLKHTQFLKDFDLTPPQFNVLRILRGQKGNALSVCSIMERMLDKSSNASRIIDKLVVKRLVERTVNPQDRRAVDILITEQGLELLSQIDRQEQNLIIGVDSLSNDDAIQLNQLLNKIRNSITN